MPFMASNTAFSKSTHCKPLLRSSVDSQEFGFASNLVASSEVAPADELFFKGQLLPLQLHHRIHLVQALSSSNSCLVQQHMSTIASSDRLASSKLATHDLCQDDDDVIEFNSCRLGRDVSIEHLKDIMQSKTAEDHMLLNDMQCLQRSGGTSSCIAQDDRLKRFSKLKGLSELDCGACMQNRTVDHNGEQYGTLSWCDDEELHTCNHDMGAADCKFAGMSDAMTDPGSSSFRSQNSSFWDSGTDKDMMDSSSSRDSNGSSQDSYFQPNHTRIKAPPFISASHHHQHPHRKPMSFSIPWKSALFRRGPCSKKQGLPQDDSLTFTKMGFSEDLGKYKTIAAPALSEVKEALLPRKLEKEAANSNKEQRRLGEHQRRLSSSATNDGAANVMRLCKSSATHIVCDAGAKKSLVKDGARSFRMPNMANGVDVGAIAEEEAKKQRSAAVKQRWQMCARRLKPLMHEMKRGWMGQLRMDECGRRANCEVEHGTMICSSSRLANAQMQRRLSHQPRSGNAWKGQKLSLQQQKQAANGFPYKVLAMSSCPSSTISSPNHSGVLAVLDPINERISTSNYKAAHSSKTASKLLNHPPNKNSTTSAEYAHVSNIIKSSIKSSGNAIKSSSNGAIDGVNNNYGSMSTMQELHSALQSAIAHCKESNKKLNYATNEK